MALSEAASVREYNKCLDHQNSILYDVLQDLPPHRLTSRKPPWLNNPSFNNRSFNINDKWRERWSSSNTTNSFLVDDPTSMLPGFSLHRKEWVKLNRLRSGQGRCNYLLHKWNISPSPLCNCGEVQTTNHIVNDCPIYSYDGGLAALHRVQDDSVDYLRNLGVNL